MLALKQWTLALVLITLPLWVVLLEGSSTLSAMLFVHGVLPVLQIQVDIGRTAYKSITRCVQSLSTVPQSRLALIGGASQPHGHASRSQSLECADILQNLGSGHVVLASALVIAAYILFRCVFWCLGYRLRSRRRAHADDVAYEQQLIQQYIATQQRLSTSEEEPTSTMVVPDNYKFFAKHSKAISTSVLQLATSYRGWKLLDLNKIDGVSVDPEVKAKEEATQQQSRFSRMRSALTDALGREGQGFGLRRRSTVSKQKHASAEEIRSGPSSGSVTPTEGSSFDDTSWHSMRLYSRKQTTLALPPKFRALMLNNNPKLFKVEIDVKYDVHLVWDALQNMSSWQPYIEQFNVLDTVTQGKTKNSSKKQSGTSSEHVYVARTKYAGKLGILTSRDFIDLYSDLELSEGIYFKSCASVLFASAPKRRDIIRGYNGPQGWIVRKIDTDHTRVVWIINSDLSGKMPVRLIHKYVQKMVREVMLALTRALAFAKKGFAYGADEQDAGRT